ncbi:hypothetical protein G7046_g2886 [Stylonectria norvegica]|nr:hypothetical protein G7046_g2886 [Stylonectria norvegica]
MVKVAIAGANSGLALEVIDKLVEGGQHQVLALCRKDPAQFPSQPGVTWVQTSYKDKAELVKIFTGVEVVLNFIVVNNDPGNVVSTLLVDAAIEAGVKRFAPSEWGMSQKLHDMIEKAPWYQAKVDMQAYLRKINKEKKVIEYTLFQPGMFMEYAAYPRKITKHVATMATAWQLEDLRIITVSGTEDKPVTLTSIPDIAAAVRGAIEYEGEWPEVGGISGDQITPRQLQQIVQKIRGQPVSLELVEQTDLDAGILKVKLPLLEHPSIPKEESVKWYIPGWVAILTAINMGAWTSTKEWNKLLPGLKFTSAEEFVKRTWGNQ